MIVFAHPDSLEEALATVQANVLDGMEVLVMEFISVLKSRATLVRKGEENLGLGLVLAELCPRRIDSGVLVPNQRFMTPLELTHSPPAGSWGWRRLFLNKHVIVISTCYTHSFEASQASAHLD